MYLNFFNLKREPFQITPDPSFLYLSQGHKEALASIIYGVEKKKGFILIVGDVGVGKTTILRAYLEKAEKAKLKTIYLFNSNISYHNLLRYIFSELGVNPVSDDICNMVSQLNKILIEEYKQGKNILLLIDEAQNMPADTLENLRMLSNLETTTEKLIQIVFSAQPEFEKTLNLEELKQLRQRIAVKATIKPLNAKEALHYINYRIMKAAEQESILFSALALRGIIRSSGGIPRVINVLCDNCLISAFGYGSKRVSSRIVREIVHDLGIRNSYSFKLLYTTTVAIVLVIFFLGAILYLSGPRENPFGQQQILLSRPKHERAEVVPEAPSHILPVDSLPSKVVEKGDTLARLIKAVYGRVDSGLIRLVKKANPGIDDENLIIEGGRIVFPPQTKQRD